MFFDDSQNLSGTQIIPFAGRNGRPECPKGWGGPGRPLINAEGELPKGWGGWLGNPGNERFPSCLSWCSCVRAARRRAGRASWPRKACACMHAFASLQAGPPREPSELAPAPGAAGPPLLAASSAAVRAELGRRQGPLLGCRRGRRLQGGRHLGESPHCQRLLPPPCWRVVDPVQRLRRGA